MKEQIFLNIIKKQIGDKYIGDDCAYLKDFNLVVTQDSFVEDVHFKRAWTTPYQIGYKSVAVNISDVLASGAKPVYLTVALSLPKDIDEKFIEEFYKGANDALCGAEIVGGDITGSNDKIMISITALGDTKNRKISSRSHASEGYVVITNGKFGESAEGLRNLFLDNKENRFVKSHLEPNIEVKFSKSISKNINCDYAMMDTSDGLADALFQIAKASGVKLIIDKDKIPHEKEITDFEQILFGGEDYNLIAVVPEEVIEKVENYTIIGKACKLNDENFVEIGEYKFSNYNQIKVYNHFGERHE